MYLYVLAGLCVRVCIGASRKEVHLTAATATTTQYLDSMTVLCWLVFASPDLDLCTTKKADVGRACGVVGAAHGACWWCVWWGHRCCCPCACGLRL